ncbi:PREDICTED: uncharacterized protein LOC105363889 [Ceratosolen solmsi marchali]|uniref:Uncharacterized protein LOC105363889 n=1 Tax=Ceratosolen solmsi marchali TaxID=326594 RepID=A0AAJ7DXG6_9HYME|nr:PREDICTED: uncharacterized protein LOC105363889 [Ceratosolen solmsi marchali]
MPMKTVGGAGLGVVAGDVLALRGTGLAAPETWALLCQAAQALQDLFLSNGGVVGGSRSGPVVTPHTLELTPRGRVMLLQAPPDTARAYLPPEYRPGRVYSDTDSEKMWMYSLGRALLDTTPRVTALTGTVSVSPSSALQSVLAAMTEPDPRRRASLMNLLDVISEYCRTRLQSRPFTHIVMDMYREVVRSTQYAARKRAVLQPTKILPPIPIQQHQQQQQQQHSVAMNAVPTRQNPPPFMQQMIQHQQLPQQQQQPRHRGKGMVFRVQSRNSRSQPNLLSMSNSDGRHGSRTNVDDGSYGYIVDPHPRHQHVRTNSQPECCMERGMPSLEYLRCFLLSVSVRCAIPTHPSFLRECMMRESERERPKMTNNVGEKEEKILKRITGAGTTIPQVRSSSNLAAMSAAVSAADARNAKNPFYGEPIYAMPVKPFLSSQDVSKANAATRQFQRTEARVAHQAAAIARNRCGKAEAQSSLPRLDSDLCPGQTPMAKMQENVYGSSTKNNLGPVTLQRQHSSPQFSSTHCSQEQKLWDFANPLPDTCGNNVVPRAHNAAADANIDTRQREQNQQKLKQLEQKANSEGRIPYVPRGPPPPKPPRIITSLKKAAAAQAALDAQVRANVKPQRLSSASSLLHLRRDLKNGPRARRGRAVQRAPSRLYRTVNGSAQSFNKTQCVGPEFVVRANQPAKLLTVGDFKVNNIGRLTVILLTGQRLEVTCDPQKITAGELFHAIVQMEVIEENFTLGLAALLAGDFAILPSDTKLNKVAPAGWLNSGKNKGLLGLPTSFMLYLRLRFFLPSLRGIRGWIPKHLLYLQIRRCILEQQLICPLTQLINLTGLALQAEFGNYSANEHGCGDYFLLEHYVPESLILNSEEQQYRHPQLPDSGEALRKRLQQAHRERRGLDANKAEEMFVVHAQSLTDYGAHYYIATVDTKELGKLVARQKKCADQNLQNEQQPCQQIFYAESENIYDIDKFSDYPIYGKIDFHTSTNIHEQNLQRSPYTDEQKIMLSKSPTNVTHESCSTPRKSIEIQNNNNNNNRSPSKTSKFKKNESDVWLAIHSQGLKVFERGARLRERLELAKFQWKDIQTLSYGKNCLVIYSRISGKRCKFKLKMDHRKSYYAFKLTSLHHQFFLKLRSELTSLQGLVKDFGVALTAEPNLPPLKTKAESAKTKISIADSVKKHQEYKSKYRTRLEEEQNKENENPLKVSESHKSANGKAIDSSINADESNALYAQVNARLEPEGESRDTEDEADRALIINGKILGSPSTNAFHAYEHTKNDRLYNYANIGVPYGSEKEEYVYTIPKPYSTNDIDRLNEKMENPEDLYTAINKSSFPKKTKLPGHVAEEWKEIEIQKTLNKVKTSNLPNYDPIRQNENHDSSNKPCNLDVKVDSKTTYSTLTEKDTNPADALETESIHSASAKSTESPIPEAYVLNIRTCEETFRIPDETMSTSLMARLDELSFDEERMLRTIKLERGQGGSIGLQVTEGNDGGVYVQAVSVGGSADMAGNVNKGDRIVAINGQSLLNFRYEDALKMLQSSSETVELVLSQIVLINNCDNRVEEASENSYLQNIRFNVSSETETGVMSSKWLQKTIDVVSVQNTSSAYSSAASSAMGNHNANNLYVPNIDETNAINSASMLLSLEDFDISNSSTQQVFI